VLQGVIFDWNTFPLTQKLLPYCRKINLNISPPKKEKGISLEIKNEKEEIL